MNTRKKIDIVFVVCLHPPVFSVIVVLGHRMPSPKSGKVFLEVRGYSGAPWCVFGLRM